MFIVFLFYLGLAMCFIVPVLGGLLGSGIHLAETMVKCFSRRAQRIGVWLGFTAVVAVFGFLFTFAMLHALPDYRTSGDGGIGGMFNLIQQFAALLLCPAGVAWTVGWFMHEGVGVLGWDK